MIPQAVEKLTILLQGAIPRKFDCSTINNPEDRKFARAVNRLVTFMQEIHHVINPLARGQLSDLKLSSNNFLASPFKELHSRLCHLTWQAKQVAGGDYSQRVDFMGEFSEAFNAMIIALDHHEKKLKAKIHELEQALSHIKRLEGILPICAHCKRIRLEGGDPKKQEDWIKIESYLSTRTDAQFSHTICPECSQKLYPGFAKP